MNLSTFMPKDAVFSCFPAKSRKHVLQDVGRAMAKISGQSDRLIFQTLLQRERLGSTGIGNGIAIPHGTLAGIDQLVGGFFQLAHPVDFEAPDGDLVDLVFVLLAPEDTGADHLNALGSIARVLRTPGMPEELRTAHTKDMLHSLLSEASAVVEG